MWRSLFGSIAGLFSFLTVWKQGRERDKDRRSGEDRATLRHLEGDVEASREMRGIEDATRRLNDSDRLDALRRFMSDDNTLDSDDR